MTREKPNKIGFRGHSIIFVKYLIIFFLVPIVGTLLHEFGHYIVAVSSGHQARIAYAYTTSDIHSFAEPELVFYYILAGPIATWIQSAIPFVIMIVYYNKERRETIAEKGDLPPLYILLIGFTAFSARFVTNAAGFMFTHSTRLDEARIADTLGIYPDIIVYPFAFIAWTMLLISIYLIPRNFRFSFTLGAIFGAALGYITWYYFLGEILLPVIPFD